MAKMQPIERELVDVVDSDRPLCSALLNRHSRGGSWRSGIYGVFQEMEECDAHLCSALQTRRIALLGNGWKIVPAGEGSAERAVARTVEETLLAVPAFDETLNHLLDAIGKGFAVAEVVWRTGAAHGAVRIEAIRPRAQWHFAFDADGALYFMRDEAHASASVPRGAARLLPRPGEYQVFAHSARRMPGRKFLHFAFQPALGSPYGSPLCARAFGYYHMKKNALKYWARFNEKFGQPTTVARMPAGATDEERAFVNELLHILPRQGGIVLPDNVNLEFLEAGRVGASGCFRELVDWCNDEISKLVLGQTLTSGEGRRSGSLALGQVHERVRRDYLLADARALSAVLTSQLVRWIVDFNHGTHVAAPRFVFDVSDPADYAADLQVDQQLIRLGVPLGTGYFYEKYQRPAPRNGERDLRYDDANLYQYHLQYGVLTINEVREALGLERVAWGDVPPRPGVAARAEPATADADSTESAEREPNEERNDRRRR